MVGFAIRGRSAGHASRSAQTSHALRLDHPIGRPDLGKALFAGWRYTAEGAEDPGFILNRPGFRDCGILVTGRNFGCGSSRENAVWALEAYGIRCIVAASFSDVFTENCFKNGLLPVALDEALVDRLAREVEALAGGQPVTVDLLAQEIRAPGGWTARFAVDRHHRGQTRK